MTQRAGGRSRLPPPAPGCRLPRACSNRWSRRPTLRVQTGWTQTIQSHFWLKRARKSYATTDYAFAISKSFLKKVTFVPESVLCPLNKGCAWLYCLPSDNWGGPSCSWTVINRLRKPASPARAMAGDGASAVYGERSGDPRLPPNRWTRMLSPCSAAPKYSEPPVPCQWVWIGMPGTRRELSCNVRSWQLWTICLMTDSLSPALALQIVV